MNEVEWAVVYVLAMHNAGVDIDSISSTMRKAFPGKAVGVHHTNSIIGAYKNANALVDKLGTDGFIEWLRERGGIK